MPRSSAAARNDELNPDEAPPKSRVGITLSGDALRAAHEIAELQGISGEGEVVRRALAFLRLYEHDKAAGTQFLIKRKGSQPEVMTVLFS